MGVKARVVKVARWDAIRNGTTAPCLRLTDSELDAVMNAARPLDRGHVPRWARKGGGIKESAER
jgi:hypothetical protein